MKVALSEWNHGLLQVQVLMEVVRLLTPLEALQITSYLLYRSSTSLPECSPMKPTMAKVRVTFERTDACFWLLDGTAERTKIRHQMLRINTDKDYQFFKVSIPPAVRAKSETCTCLICLFQEGHIYISHR